MKDYGIKKTNPDYWMRVSENIWHDPSYTQDEKIKAQEELIKLYYSEKREKKTITTGVKSHLYSNIRNAIGYSQSESDARVKKELLRLKDKSSATWKGIERKAGLSKKEILKEFGIES